MSLLKPGYIVKISNSQYPETTGVIIDSTQNGLICFNVDDNKRPMFYRVDLSKTNYQPVDGKTINHTDFMDLKKAILQYYHINKDNHDEIKLLDNIL